MTMLGRHLIHTTYLTFENLDEVGEAVRDVLWGKQFTMIAVNGLFGFRPEARSGQTLSEFTVRRYPTDAFRDAPSAAIQMGDGGYYTSLHTWQSTQREAIDYAAERPKSALLTAIEIVERQVMVFQYTAAGQPLYWLWTVEGDPWPIEHRSYDACPYCRATDWSYIVGNVALCTRGHRWYVSESVLAEKAATATV